MSRHAYLKVHTFTAHIILHGRAPLCAHTHTHTHTHSHTHTSHSIGSLPGASLLAVVASTTICFSVITWVCHRQTDVNFFRFAQTKKKCENAHFGKGRGRLSCFKRGQYIVYRPVLYKRAYRFLARTQKHMSIHKRASRVAARSPCLQCFTPYSTCCTTHYNTHCNASLPTLHTAPHSTTHTATHMHEYAYTHC